MTKGNLAWSGTWSDEFKIKFDVIVTSEPTEDWNNVLHVTTGNNCCGLGERIPSVSIYRGEYIEICFGVSGNNNYCKNYNIVLHRLYHLEISQNKTSNGEAVYKISVDGTIFHEVINTTPKNFQNAKLYLSDPWHASFAPHGTLSNLRTNSKLDRGD